MISDKKELRKYLDIECVGRKGIRRLKDFFIPSEKSYLYVLRLTEYYSNKKGVLHRIIAKFLKFKLDRYQVATGITIPVNVCAEGLTLYHFGSIVVSDHSTIGKNCCIMNNLNIGANKGEVEAPKIGNDVYIGPGAVLYGNIAIADGCYIGANAVVNKSYDEPYSIIAGIPAKVIGKETAPLWKYNRLQRD